MLPCMDAGLSKAITMQFSQLCMQVVVLLETEEWVQEKWRGPHASVTRKVRLEVACEGAQEGRWFLPYGRS